MLELRSSVTIQRHSGRSVANIDAGTHAARVSSSCSAPLNDGAVTPITVKARPFSKILRPTIAESAPNDDCQVRWLSTTTDPNPGSASSAGVMPRPRKKEARNMAK